MKVFNTDGSQLVTNASAAPTTSKYVLLETDGTLANERVLTGTSNQIVVTDNGAGSTVVLSTPQSIHTGASPTFAALTLTAPLTIGNGGTGVALSDPNADRILFWDESAGAGGQTAFLTMGNSIAITTTTLDTIQDIRTTATPQFTRLGIGAAADSVNLLTFTQPVATTGSPVGLLYTGGAHTTLTASTEAIDWNINLARTVQFAQGALTTQRAILIQAPTYAFATGASTLTNAHTLEISGAPIAGTNATITYSTAFHIAAGSVLWESTTGATPAAGGGTRFMWIPAKSALRAGTANTTEWDASNVGTYSAAFGQWTKANGGNAMAGGLQTIAQGSFSFAYGREATATGDYSVAFGYASQATGSFAVAMGGISNVASANYSCAIGRNFTNSTVDSFAVGWGAEYFHVSGLKTTGSPTSFLHTAPAHTTLSNADLTLASFALGATAQFVGAAGSTTINNTYGLNITAPVYSTSGAGATTITTASALYISGAPSTAAGGGGTTITNPYSLFIDAGLPRIDSTTANGSVAVSLTSVGPTGAQTTVQEWLTISINGTTRYIPCF